MKKKKKNNPFSMNSEFFFPFPELEGVTEETLRRLRKGGTRDINVKSVKEAWRRRISWLVAVLFATTPLILIILGSIGYSNKKNRQLCGNKEDNTQCLAMLAVGW
jgi:hypothetical protein